MVIQPDIDRGYQNRYPTMQQHTYIAVPAYWPITQAIQPPYVPEDGQAEGQAQTHVEADYLGAALNPLV